MWVENKEFGKHIDEILLKLSEVMHILLLDSLRAKAVSLTTSIVLCIDKTLDPWCWYSVIEEWRASLILEARLHMLLKLLPPVMSFLLPSLEVLLVLSWTIYQAF